ncbi:MAG: hypothetical protein QY323_02740 [Patescibacteria group bacterium]|nr:MAG: hypothetical protein QY323_02740 [Patescibacteria group bacterium]
MTHDVTKTVKSEILHLDSLAKKDGWVFEYDSEMDSLEWGLPKMPRNARLYNVNKEISLYLTPKGLVKGVFIEYYRNNFVEHNKKFKKFTKLLTSRKKDGHVALKVRNKKEDEVGHYIDDLAKEVTIVVCSSKSGSFAF